jgi:hypothetical protein
MLLRLTLAQAQEPRAVAQRSEPLEQVGKYVPFLKTPSSRGRIGDFRKTGISAPHKKRIIDLADGAWQTE